MTTRNSKCSLKSDINLVEQILEQGQRLRTAMVETILNNDPFNIDIMKTRNFKSYSESDTLKPMHVISNEDQQETKSLTLEDKHKFLAYLRGEKMTKPDERKVLDTFKAMSNADICDATERSYSSDYSCYCDTCKAYYKHNLNCDFNHSSSILCKDKYNIPPLDFTKNPKLVSKIKHAQFDKVESSNINTSQADECLKYVDSLRISVHSLILNQEGNKKVYGGLINNRIKLPISISHTYFIEYQIPEAITKFVLRSKSKVDSGLESHNLVRMCSKKLHNEAIYFKQISLHDIINLGEIDLAEINIKFQISCRTLKQKSSNVLGYAIFNMASFLNTRNLTLNQDLFVKLNADAPIVVGTLRISLQLGCEQLYFGKEFIDAIYSNKENIKYNCDSENNIAQLETKHENSEESVSQKDVYFSDKHYEIINKNNVSGSKSNREEVSGKQHKLNTSPVKESTENTNRSPKIACSSRDEPNNSRKNMFSELKINDSDKQVLFGFIYVGDAQFSTVRDNTFVTCQPFCQDDVLYSRLVHRSSNPNYAFNQVLPFVYDDSFLNKLRDNYMIFEFWETVNSQDNLIGISKISLHQFYVAFRNPVITKYLNRNRLPVICCDRWEPICNPLTGEIYGQAQILITLGADVQIHNLRLDRGFENESVILKSARSDISKQLTQDFSIVNKQQQDRNTTATRENSNRSEEIIKNPSNTDAKNSTDKKRATSKKKFNHQRSPSPKLNNKKNFVDVAIQSDMGDSQDNSKPNLTTQTSDVLGALLAQLLQQRQKNYVENSTNTEHKQIISTAQSNVTVPENNTNVDNMKIRRTSDLLDTLQQALAINQLPQTNTSRTFRRSIDTFRAHIVVENALHLPSRKKCSAKIIKGKTRREEILPSAYVSFETVSELKVTKVIGECKNPEWDYSCDVELPADLLTNSQKRMIFKIWKKATNYAPFEPNFESDTVLGFAALDLTVLLAGLPTVSGWFNIIDFSNKCNGQIKISVTPLENLQRFIKHRLPFAMIQTNSAPSSIGVDCMSPEIQTERIEEPGELLNRALKRKFSELDEITQRLKLRLSNVTNDESDTSNDEFADEFENDINTLCVEEDYDMINFDEESPGSETQEASSALLQIQNTNFIYKYEDLLMQKIESDKCVLTSHDENEIKGMGNDDTSRTALNLNIDCGLSSVGVVSRLDKQLIEGKQKIDSLLEKLSLLNHNEAEIFDNRYVSGCSAKQDSSKPISDKILNDISKDIDPISTDISSDNSTTNVHTAYINKKPFNNISSSSTSSNSGLLAQYAEYRLAPDGAGHTPNDKIKTVNITVGTTSNS